MRNNKRGKRIDEFLKYLAKKVEQNPDYQLDVDSIYYKITLLGVGMDDKGYDVAENDFDKWISYFHSSRNLKAFVDTKWNYFCQFVSKKRSEFRKISNSLNNIKLYIPVDSEHIQESAKLIFDFISKNNIVHASKIGANIRCDDIVIRLVNVEDAKKIIDFVKNNKYIQEGLIDSNPFVPSVHGVGFVCDGSLSYNNTMAILVCSYIKGLKKDRRLSSASFDDFKRYVGLYERYLFDSNIKDWYLSEGHPAFQSTGMFYMVNDIIDVYSLRGIFELFSKSFDNKFSLEDYFELYNNLLDPDEYYKSLKNKEKDEQLDISFDEFNSIIRILMKTMGEKYGEQTAFFTIVDYFETGVETSITRKYGLRDFMEKMDIRNNILNYVNLRGINVRDYIKEVVSKPKNKKDILIDACQLTYLKNEDLRNSLVSDKDGALWAAGALYALIRKRRSDGFTRELGSRYELIENLTIKDVLFIMADRLNISVDELNNMNNFQFREVCESFIYKILNLGDKIEKKHY